MGAICGLGFAGIDTVSVCDSLKKKFISYFLQLIAGQALVEDVLFGQLNDFIYVRVSDSLEPVAQLGLGPASWGIYDRLIGREPVLFKLAKQSNFSVGAF